MVVHVAGGTLVPWAKRQLDLPPEVRDPPRWNPFARRRAAKVKEQRSSDLLMAAAYTAAGLVLYGIGKTAWGRGPLRGGLSVFGASPHLDRCASQVRSRF